MGKAWLAPLATLYGMGVAVRNKFFDWGWLRSAKYDIPVVCVGNITVGGTGKTPVTEYLVRHLGRDFNVAVLSLGYKRRTKGYLEVQAGTPFLDSGDEPKQMKLKFPDIVVAVCEKRAAGIERIREDHPEINLVLLDDAFQHRYVEPWVNIVLMDYNRPIWRDHMLPRGMLRDHPSQISRANHVIVTKCPPSMTALDRRIVRKALGLYPYQGLYFSFTEAAAPRPIFPGDDPLPLKKGGTVVAMSGIASPAGFHDTLSADYRIVEKLIYPPLSLPPPRSCHDDKVAGRLARGDGDCHHRERFGEAAQCQQNSRAVAPCVILYSDRGGARPEQRERIY